MKRTYYIILVRKGQYIQTKEPEKQGKDYVQAIGLQEKKGDTPKTGQSMHYNKNKSKYRTHIAKNKKYVTKRKDF